ncbi:hypothetical protein [Nannocystis bainbridge]|uniref:Uncharacterized protein n=1 Tax=Nannocystis bainbridge TaxID=2995303 RepID=A0ABT5E9H2_9BACT|nr:hypothetical protein [Nannocystis bainbridge]MDC0721517.1 hypothetical protein [Nannocystis bainbridge]
MHRDQEPYRELHQAMFDYEGSGLAEDVVLPWARAHAEERRWFAALAAVRATTVPAMAIEDRWRLYAMGRICELLRLGFTRRAGHDAGWQLSVPAAAYAEFMAAFGFERVTQAEFHPFFHEVVTVAQAADEDAPPGVLAEAWPGHMLGPLLFARAGCHVAAGRRHLVKDIAEGSTLYWAYARNNRPVHDLSQGWGSNSQWRTALRRDYAIAGELHYNVDADPSRPPDEDGLAPADWRELVRHRCFVRCAERHDERFPYDRSHREPQP